MLEKNPAYQQWILESMIERVSSNPPREKGIVKGKTFLWETVLLKNSSQNEQELTKVIQM